MMSLSAVKVPSAVALRHALTTERDCRGHVRNARLSGKPHHGVWAVTAPVDRGKYTSDAVGVEDTIKAVREA